MSIFIDRASQVSIQQPLCDEWFNHPQMPTDVHARLIQPDIKQWIAPATSRRMNTLLRCAVANALHCVPEEKRKSLDGILTGTGLGCIESTEKFLNSMIDNNEESLSPSNFILSTQNTISSQIAIALHCNGYNISYAHRGTSFDSAMLNAVIKFQLGEFSSALVNATDEMSDEYFELLRQVGYWKESVPSIDEFQQAVSKGSFSGECCTSFLLTNQQSENTLCEIVDTHLLYCPTDEKIGETIHRLMQEGNCDKIDAIVIGNNADVDNDREYARLCQLIDSNAPQIIYKHLFGENYSMSAMGIYVASQILHKGFAPEHLTIARQNIDKIKNLLVINHFQKLDYSFTLLKSC